MVKDYTIGAYEKMRMSEQVHNYLGMEAESVKYPEVGPEK